MYYTKSLKNNWAVTSKNAHFQVAKYTIQLWNELGGNQLVKLSSKLISMYYTNVRTTGVNCKRETQSKVAMYNNVERTSDSF